MKIVKFLKNSRYPECFVQNYSYGLSYKNLESEFANKFECVLKNDLMKLLIIKPILIFYWFFLLSFVEILK